ncbi:MAG TPA: hypothetical protein VFQ85_13280 [Mycobacteriales bacterium]|nr:hypothetical protein [Mycobacteriales bacterium]
MRIRAALVAGAVTALLTAAFAVPAHACMGCDDVCVLLTSRPVQKVTHSDNCPVE